MYQTILSVKNIFELAKGKIIFVLFKEKEKKKKEKNPEKIDCT